MAHPTVLRGVVAFVLTSLFTSVFIPYITNGWQDHQKELDLKSSVVSEVSAAATTMIVAVQAKEYVGGGGKAYNDAYTNWEITSEELAAKLSAYLPPTGGHDVPGDWRRYADLVDQMVALSDCSASGQATRPDDFAALKSDMLALARVQTRGSGEVTLGTVLDPITHRSGPLPVWNGWNVLKECPPGWEATPVTINGVSDVELVKGSPYEDYWWQLRNLSLLGKDVISREVLDTDMPVYTHFFDRLSKRLPSP